MALWIQTDSERKTYTLWLKRPKVSLSFEYNKDCPCPWVKLSVFVRDKGLELSLQVEPQVLAYQARLINET